MFYIFQLCVISDCGELAPGEEAVKDDGTGDLYPDFPTESDIDFTKVNCPVTFWLAYIKQKRVSVLPSISAFSVMIIRQPLLNSVFDFLL